MNLLQGFQAFELDADLVTLISQSRHILLVGPSGSGKTSILQVLTHATSENVLSMTNLREQGVQFYRENVRTFCQTAISGIEKTVVLDDLDTVTEQGQQIMRNYIDKYGHHVTFIASCSNLQKVIEPLQSRLTLIQLEPLGRDAMRIILCKRASVKGVVIDSAAIESVLDLCQSSVNLLDNYIEKFRLLEYPVNTDLVDSVCTNIPHKIFRDYISRLLTSDLVAAHILLDVYDSGYSVMDIMDNLFFFCKITPMLTEAQKYAVVPYICQTIAAFHTVHEDEIELVLFSRHFADILNGNVHL